MCRRDEAAEHHDGRTAGTPSNTLGKSGTFKAIDTLREILPDHPAGPDQNVPHLRSRPILHIAAAPPLSEMWHILVRSWGKILEDFM